MPSRLSENIPIMSYPENFGISGMSPTEEARLYVLLLCCIRFVVEKHGGTMETDPVTHNANVSIPRNKKAVCCQELRVLLGQMP